MGKTPASPVSDCVDNCPPERCRERERALLEVLLAYLSPTQASAAEEQWEAVLVSRPELESSEGPDLPPV